MKKTVTYTPAKTSHLLHLVLTILTAGLWFPIWMLIAFLNLFCKDKTVSYEEEK